MYVGVWRMEGWKVRRNSFFVGHRGLAEMLQRVTANSKKLKLCLPKDKKLKVPYYYFCLRHLRKCALLLPSQGSENTPSQVFAPPSNTVK